VRADDVVPVVGLFRKVSCAPLSHRTTRAIINYSKLSR
jgi:hypothetical protein